MTFHADPRKNKKSSLVACMRWAAAQPKIVLCERERERLRHPPSCHTNLSETHCAAIMSAYFFSRALLFILFSLTLSLSKTFRGCVMSPLFFFLPTFHAERPSLSLSFLSMLSSICYKVMSPLFRHGPMQTPPLKLHYRPAGRLRPESF